MSPIQGAYWFVGRVLTGGIHSAAARALYENNANAALSAAKFDLYRAWVDASGTILNDSAEVVAEYAVDLKLGFTVDYWTGKSHYESGRVNEKRSVSGLRIGLAFRY